MPHFYIFFFLQTSADTRAPLTKTGAAASTAATTKTRTTSAAATKPSSSGRTMISARASTSAIAKKPLGIAHMLTYFLFTSVGRFILNCYTSGDFDTIQLLHFGSAVRDSVIYFISFTVLIICVSASTTDNKAREEKKLGTIRTSAGTEYITVLQF